MIEPQRLRWKDRAWGPRSLLRFAPLLIVGATMLGCSIVRGLSDGVNRESRTEVETMLEQFWAAAAANDSTTLRSLSASPEPVEWVARWREHHPSLFRSTATSFAPVIVRRAGRSADSLDAIATVRYQTCDSLVYGVRPDRYVFQLVRREDRWLISAVYRPVC